MYHLRAAVLRLFKFNIHSLRLPCTTRPVYLIRRQHNARHLIVDTLRVRSPSWSFDSVKRARTFPRKFIVPTLLRSWIHRGCNKSAHTEKTVTVTLRFGKTMYVNSSYIYIALKAAVCCVCTHLCTPHLLEIRNVQLVQQLSYNSRTIASIERLSTNASLLCFAERLLWRRNP